MRQLFFQEEIQIPEDRCDRLLAIMVCLPVDHPRAGKDLQQRVRVPLSSTFVVRSIVWGTDTGTQQ